MSSASRKRVDATAWLAGLLALAALVITTLAEPKPALPATQPASLDDALVTPGTLTVAADPNNLPFSNDKLEGFENKIAQLVADDLGLKLDYVWRASRRGFVRETLKANAADLVIGTPTAVDMLQPTLPYYRATYGFVTRKSDPAITSFDDPRLPSLTIGVPLTGDANPPANLALAKRNLIANVQGFPIYADYAQPNPTARLLDALANRSIDVAIAWGPLAGYFADKEATPLVFTPISPDEAQSLQLPFAFNIAMGVKRGNTVLKQRLDSLIERRRPELEKILDAYHVPRLKIERTWSDPKGDKKPDLAPCDCN